MKSLLLAFVLLGILSSFGNAQTLSVHDLPDGATLIVSQEPKNPNVVIEAFFRVGVADETGLGESGLSTLLARTWTIGTTNRSAGQIASDIGRFGTLGIWNTRDYIELWTVSSTTESEIAAQTLLLHIVSTPLFLSSTVQNAKRIISQERLLRSDTLLSEALHRLRGHAFANSPAGRDLLGDPDNIARAKATDLQRFYAKTVGRDASRAVFVVAGGIEPEEAKHLISTSLAAGDWLAWRNKETPPKPVSMAAPEPIPAGLKRLDLYRPAPTHLVVMGFIAPGTMAGAKATATLQLLDAVIGGGKNCRLFALRDNPQDSHIPIGYDVRSRIEAGREQSLWVAYVSGTTQSSQATQAILLAQVRPIADGSQAITEDELKRAKQFLKGKHRRERQRLSDRASALGYAEVMGLGATFESDYEAQIDAIQLADVNTLAKQIFQTHAATVTTGTEP